MWIFKLWSQAIRAMLKETLSIDCNLRTVVDSVWFADCYSGNYDLAIGGLVSALLDPSNYFNAWYGKDGPQNHSQWNDQDFQALSAHIDREIDAEKRQELVAVPKRFWSKTRRTVARGLTARKRVKRAAPLKAGTAV
jgi:ABC-type oligopeptide transport system substrate-binding subunit